MRSSVNMYFKEMIYILNSVPRQMLLILKTNALSRRVEHSLMGTPYNSASMGIITMTKYSISRINNVIIQLLFRNKTPVITLLGSVSLHMKLYWHLFNLCVISLFI